MSTVKITGNMYVTEAEIEDSLAELLAVYAISGPPPEQAGGNAALVEALAAVHGGLEEITKRLSRLEEHAGIAAVEHGTQASHRIHLRGWLGAIRNDLKDIKDRPLPNIEEALWQSAAKEGSTRHPVAYMPAGFLEELGRMVVEKQWPAQFAMPTEFAADSIGMEPSVEPAEQSAVPAIASNLTPQRTCVICGKPLVKRPRANMSKVVTCGDPACQRLRNIQRGRQRRRDDATERLRLGLPACGVCGRPFKPVNRLQKTCATAECRTEWRRRLAHKNYMRGRGRAPKREGVCVICGETFNTRAARQITCLRPACRGARNSARNRDRTAEIKAGLRAPGDRKHRTLVVSHGWEGEPQIETPRPPRSHFATA